jgi:hypothetical protein
MPFSLPPRTPDFVDANGVEIKELPSHLLVRRDPGDVPAIVHDERFGRPMPLAEWCLRPFRRFLPGLLRRFQQDALIAATALMLLTSVALAAPVEDDGTVRLTPFGIIHLLSRHVRPGAVPETPPAVGGTYDYLAPIYTLPTGMTHNDSTGFVEGEVFDTAYSAPATVVTLTDSGTRSTNKAALDAAIANAATTAPTPTRIRIPATADFGGQYQLPINTSGGWIYLETDTVQGGTFVAEGTTVTLANAGLMPKMYQTATNVAVFHLPKGVCKYRFVGLHLAYAPTGVAWNSDSTPAQNNQIGLISTVHSDGTRFSTTTNGSLYQSDVVIDRCIISGIDGKNLRRATWLNGTRMAMINSWVDEVRNGPATGLVDGQGLFCEAGPGPYKIDQNMFRVGARGEHILFGGGNNGVVPADIQVTRNTFDFPIAWWGTLEIKNLFELKIGIRALIQGNRFHNAWLNGIASQYYTIAFKSVDQSHGTYPQSETRDVTVRLNEFKNCSGGVAVATLPEGYGIAMSRIDYCCNRVLKPTSNFADGTVPRDWNFQSDELAEMRVMHSSFYGGPRNDANSFTVMYVAMASGQATGHQWRDNLIVLDSINAGNWMATDNGLGSGNTAWNNLKGANGVYTGNALTKTSTVPAGNTTVASLATANLNASTFALDPASPLIGVATDGRDPGPVHSLIDTAMTEVPT